MKEEGDAGSASKGGHNATAEPWPRRIQDRSRCELYRGTDELTLVLWCYWLLQRPKYSGPAFPTELPSGKGLLASARMGAGASFSDQRSGLLRLTRRRLRRRSRAEPPDSGPSVPGHVTRAKSRLHYVLFITALIVWNRTRAPTSWTLTFVVGILIDNAFSFTFWTGFHS